MIKERRHNNAVGIEKTAFLRAPAFEEEDLVAVEVDDPEAADEDPEVAVAELFEVE